jgi:hypothetical protein
MKQLLVLISLFVLSCENDNKTTNADAPSADSTKNETLTYAYTPSYSAQLEMGNPKHAQMIVGLWKDWDNNNLENSRNIFADSCTMIFADGTTMSASRDSIMASSKKFRSRFSSVTSTVHAWMPILAKDKNENWVAVWGTEVSTMNGKTDSVNLHEIWRLNNNNQVVYMRQFSGKLLKKKY